MKYDTPFDLISIEFGKAPIPVLLVGGFAVNSYRVSRQTGDIDFLIDEKDYVKVKKILSDAGYKEILSEKVFSKFSNETDELHFLEIDILFTDTKTIKDMIKAGKQVIVGKNNFIVPSLDHLLAMKLHSLKSDPGKREFKDLMDILNLVKNNNIDSDSEEFKFICVKYGTDEIYKNIINLLKKQK